jgi:hypothetical protein
MPRKATATVTPPLQRAPPVEVSQSSDFPVGSFATWDAGLSQNIGRTMGLWTVHSSRPERRRNHER